MVNVKYSLGNIKYSLSQKTITERNISTADCVAAGICVNTQSRHTPHKGDIHVDSNSMGDICLIYA